MLTELRSSDFAKFRDQRLKKQKEEKVAKKPKKIKPTEPVKIDFDLTPMHTASLMSNIRDSSIYKLLKNPKVIGVDLGHDAIIFCRALVC